MRQAIRDIRHGILRSARAGNVRRIKFDEISRAVENLCMACAHELPSDMMDAFVRAEKAERNPRARNTLGLLIENAGIAAKELIPMCQDTGLAIVFAEQGGELVMTPDERGTITDAINAGVAAGYEKGYLRKSLVAEPLNERKNTGTNTPAIIHYSIVPGDKLKITLMAKGGGSENRSQFRMFKPTASAKEVGDWVVEVVKNAGADACPPFVVGVGLGGNFEFSCLLAKKALLRKLGSSNPDPFYAAMEKEIFERVNKLDIGPQGMGGDTTALGLAIETAGCHI
ncbi:MAG TPA: fumarate hydratase, partial [Sedimentisphaerales bacterium]|nr:fumarate hydratase [Sedimentisphaerales bacterium]